MIEAEPHEGRPSTGNSAVAALPRVLWEGVPSSCCGTVMIPVMHKRTFDKGQVISERRINSHIMLSLGDSCLHVSVGDAPKGAVLGITLCVTGRLGKREMGCW